MRDGDTGFSSVSEGRGKVHLLCFPNVYMHVNLYAWKASTQMQSMAYFPTLNFVALSFLSLKFPGAFFLPFCHQTENNLLFKNSLNTLLLMTRCNRVVLSGCKTRLRPLLLSHLTTMSWVWEPPRSTPTISDFSLADRGFSQPTGFGTFYSRSLWASSSLQPISWPKLSPAPALKQEILLTFKKVFAWLM